MNTMVDQSAIAAIASAALFYEHCPDGNAGIHGVSDPDARWPDEVACEAVGIEVGATGPIGDAFGSGFMLGLQLGARIGADPLQRPLVKDLLDQCSAEIRKACVGEVAA
jgi:hypothetical protein